MGHRAQEDAEQSLLVFHGVVGEQIRLRIDIAIFAHCGLHGSTEISREREKSEFHLNGNCLIPFGLSHFSARKRSLVIPGDAATFVNIHGGNLPKSGIHSRLRGESLTLPQRT